jgi:nickel-type superoxide dismutase maturation protease
MKTANWFDIISLLFNFSQRYRVEGDSMLPTIKDGDEVLVKTVSNLEIGDVVVAIHPYRKTPIIKRITGISTSGKLFLSGDNPDESTDSRTFGEIDKKDVLGVVVCRLK